MSVAFTSDQQIKDLELRLAQNTARQVESIKNMSITELQNYPIFKKDRQRIFKEALDLAQTTTNIKYKFEPNFIEFRVHYVTNFGEDVYMVGSTQLLGNWKGEDSGQKLKWSDGHIWRIQFPRSELSDCFEFKFVIKQGLKLARWEAGLNHKFDMKKFNEILMQPNVLREIENGKYDVIEVTTDNEKVSFDRKQKLLVLQTLWQA